MSDIKQCNTEAIKKAIAILGSGWKLAKKIGVNPPTVYSWTSGQRSPDPINCLRIQKATEGQVKARDILPNYDWDNVI